MSFVGNLEDLSLGDLLQIVSMSQKSGVLVLHSAGGIGQIVFRSGLVHAAGIKGQAADLRRLLSEAGLEDRDRLEAVVAGPRRAGGDAVEAIAERAGLPVDRLEAPVRKATEAAVFEMFGWRTGEFSFDGRPEGESDEPHPILCSGINAQYLAMEGMRLLDERARAASTHGLQARDGAGGAHATQGEVDVWDDAPFFGAEPLEVDGDEAIELEASWELEAPTGDATEGSTGAPIEASTGGGIELAVERVLERDGEADLSDRADRRDEAPREGEAGSERAAPPTDRPSVAPVVLSTSSAPPPPATASAAAAPSSRTAVAIDPDAAALEWIKGSLEGHVARTHVFQRAEEGLARIRQYLIRGDTPLVLVSLATPIDPLSGIHGLADFVKRLRAQAPRIVVFGVQEAGEARGHKPGYLDAILVRPGREKPATGTSEEAELRARFLSALTATLAPGGAQGASPGGSSRAEASRSERGRDRSQPTPELGPGRLAELAAALGRAGSQHEIGALLIDAAGDLFARVALLALRDGQAFPIGSRGIEALEVDPLASPPGLSCPVPPTSLLGRVVGSGRPATGALRAQADRLLAAMFGPIEPRTAYLAPLAGPGGVVAVLYGDQGGHRRAMPDVAGLERLVEQAGGELERLALGRARGEGGGR